MREVSFPEAKSRAVRYRAFTVSGATPAILSGMDARLAKVYGKLCHKPFFLAKRIPKRVRLFVEYLVEHFARVS